MKQTYQLVFLFAAAITTPILCAAGSESDLAHQFAEPDRSAQPHVFWWWLQSSLSKEGITRDLEEMKRKGIAGALVWDGGSGTGGLAPIPSGPSFMSSEWREMFKHAVEEADRLGLEIIFEMSTGANCGGPWVTPEFATQIIVCSETKVQGPTNFSAVLPLPSEVHMDKDGRPIFYRDVAVLALPVHDGDAAVLDNWAYKSVNDLLSEDVPCEILLECGVGKPGEAIFESASFVNLSEHMDESGHLNWKAPAGNWLIIRFGHTYSGSRVSGGNPGTWGTLGGLYLDHLSREAMNMHFDSCAAKVIKDAGNLAGRTLKYVTCDSWEIGIANWTAHFRAEFQERRGYDLLAYLPVLAGKVVDSREVSNRFLYDYRKTIGDCIADNHYDLKRKLAIPYGIGIQCEAGGPHRAPIDALKCLGKNDVCMGEFWAKSPHRSSDESRFFIKQTSSAAHIYGKKLVAAEAFTTVGPQWEEDPYELKPVADRAFCEGLNRCVMHTFSYSPPEIGKPGYVYGAGTHFNPGISWWQQAHVWTEYLSRCQFLLQQGLFVADVCYYYGDNVPNFVPLKHVDPSLGAGYDYDVTNSEVILTRMSADRGRIVLPDGMSYRLLVLPKREAMTIEVLKKITELVKDGATVVGSKPSKTPGLRDYPQCDKTVKMLADVLWGSCDGETVKEHTLGKGRIVWGRTLRDILLTDGVKPDFGFISPQENTILDYIHRTSGDTEIYFVANRQDRWEEVQCSFRVIGKVPELWEPDTGKIFRQIVYHVAGGQTRLPLRLAPYGSVFVVFRYSSDNDQVVSLHKDGKIIFPGTTEKSEEFPDVEVVTGEDNQIELRVWQSGLYELRNIQDQVVKIEVAFVPQAQEISGPWEISFPKGWGAPPSRIFNELISWTEDDNPGVKYFSGTASYRKEFDVTAELLDNKYLFLDLGRVRNLAEIRLNSKNLGILWKRPFRVNISGVAKPGQNLLEVEVTNLWPNRLIGDQFLPKDKRFTETNVLKFTRDSQLLESGLLGPVRIYAAQKRKVEFDH